MQTVTELLQAIGIFLGGIVGRIGLFFAMLAVLVVPAVLIALVVRALQVRRQRALGIRQVAGLLFRPDLWYAPGHTWLLKRASAAVEVGLDDLALRILPSVTAVDLPRNGTSVRRGERLARMHGGGRAVDVVAPIDGKVVGVNSAVLRDPGLVKRDGYGRGWLVAIEPAQGALAALPQGDDAERWMRSESQRWNRFVEGRLGFATADGGELVAPAPWLVGEEGWRSLVDAFLHRS